MDYQEDNLMNYVMFSPFSHDHISPCPMISSSPADIKDNQGLPLHSSHSSVHSEMEENHAAMDCTAANVDDGMVLSEPHAKASTDVPSPFLLLSDSRATPTPLQNQFSELSSGSDSSDCAGKSTLINVKTPSSSHYMLLQPHSLDLEESHASHKHDEEDGPNREAHDATHESENSLVKLEDDEASSYHMLLNCSNSSTTDFTLYSNVNTVSSSLLSPHEVLLDQKRDFMDVGQTLPQNSMQVEDGTSVYVSISTTTTTTSTPAPSSLATTPTQQQIASSNNNNSATIHQQQQHQVAASVGNGNGGPSRSYNNYNKRLMDRYNGLSEDEVKAKELPDYLQHNLDMVIININPSLASAHVGHHYAGPGNHFWECLYESGLIPHPATFYDDVKMLDYGIGFTNFCTRPTKGTAELTRKELKQGIEVLMKKIHFYKPRIAVFNGKGIYAAYLGHKNFHMGKQAEPLKGTDTYIFVMPSSSARCAQLPQAADKLPFFVALKKMRDWVVGAVPQLNEAEVVFTDYSEMRVSQPDPKSILKAERRRRRLAEQGRITLTPTMAARSAKRLATAHQILAASGRYVSASTTITRKPPTSGTNNTTSSAPQSLAVSNAGNGVIQTPILVSSSTSAVASTFRQPKQVSGSGTSTVCKGNMASKRTSGGNVVTSLAPHPSTNNNNNTVTANATLAATAQNILPTLAQQQQQQQQQHLQQQTAAINLPTQTVYLTDSGHLPFLTQLPQTQLLAPGTQLIQVPGPGGTQHLIMSAMPTISPEKPPHSNNAAGEGSRILYSSNATATNAGSTILYDQNLGMIQIDNQQLSQLGLLTSPSSVGGQSLPLLSPSQCQQQVFTQLSAAPPPTSTSSGQQASSATNNLSTYLINLPPSALPLGLSGGTPQFVTIGSNTTGATTNSMDPNTMNTPQFVIAMPTGAGSTDIPITFNTSANGNVMLPTIMGADNNALQSQSQQQIITSPNGQIFLSTSTNPTACNPLPPPPPPAPASTQAYILTTDSNGVQRLIPISTAEPNSRDKLSMLEEVSLPSGYLRVNTSGPGTMCENGQTLVLSSGPTSQQILKMSDDNNSAPTSGYTLVDMKPSCLSTEVLNNLGCFYAANNLQISNTCKLEDNMSYNNM